MKLTCDVSRYYNGERLIPDPLDKKDTPGEVVSGARVAVTGGRPIL